MWLPCPRWECEVKCRIFAELFRKYLAFSVYCYVMYVIKIPRYSNRVLREGNYVGQL